MEMYKVLNKELVNKNKEYKREVAVLKSKIFSLKSEYFSEIPKKIKHKNVLIKLMHRKEMYKGLTEELINKNKEHKHEVEVLKSKMISLKIRNFSEIQEKMKYKNVLIKLMHRKEMYKVLTKELIYKNKEHKHEVAVLKSKMFSLKSLFFSEIQENMKYKNTLIKVIRDLSGSISEVGNVLGLDNQNVNLGTNLAYSKHQTISSPLNINNERESSPTSLNMIQQRKREQFNQILKRPEENLLPTINNCHNNNEKNIKNSTASATVTEEEIPIETAELTIIQEEETLENITLENIEPIVEERREILVNTCRRRRICRQSEEIFQNTIEENNITSEETSKGNNNSIETVFVDTSIENISQKRRVLCSTPYNKDDITNNELKVKDFFIRLSPINVTKLDLNHDKSESYKKTIRVKKKKKSFTSSPVKSSSTVITRSRSATALLKLTEPKLNSKMRRDNK